MANSIEYSIVKMQYKNLEYKKCFIIDGWAYSLDNIEIKYSALVNDEEADIDLIKKDCNEVYFKLENKPLSKKIGFHMIVDCTKLDPNSLSIFAEINNKKVEILNLNRTKINKIEDNKSIEYTIDKYFKDLKINFAEILGWTYSWDKKDVKIKIVDQKNNEIEYEIEKVARKDLIRLHMVDETNKDAGFRITFESDPKEQYYMILSTDSETTKIKLSQNSSSIYHLFKTYAKRINKENLKKGIHFFRENGLKQFIERLQQGPVDDKTVDYNKWFIAKRVTEAELMNQKDFVFEYSPKISVIVATFNTKNEYLKEMIDTVVNQSYSNWELCIADGSTNDSVEKYIKSNYEVGDKIKFVRLNDNYGIAGNMNKALEIVTGDYVGLYDHDDTLELNCLFEIVKALQNKKYDFIYTDEDKLMDKSKKFASPHFKSDFNMDLLCSVNYICHFLVVKKSLIDKVGNFRKEFDGAQDFDFVLRLSESTTPENIYHIPKILYHWRMHEQSTAENPESKMYAFEAGKRAVQAHYDRLNIDANASMGQALGWYKTTYEIIGNPLISILIPNKDHIDDLERCIESIEAKSSYKNYEYIIIENNSTEQETFEYYKKLEHENSKVKVVYWDGIFNYSAINNFGAKHANGDYYLLLNNDTEIINEDCLKELLGYCQRKDVGAVGARLFYHDDTVQHGGVIVGLGRIAGHAFLGEPRESLGYFGRLVSAQDLSAVTAACMMVKKSVFEEVHGLNEELKVAFNDIDFCMRIRNAGYLIVYNPYAELYHYESKSRGMEDSPEKKKRFNGEKKTFRENWPEIMKNGDPYYNPNLSLLIKDYTIKSEEEEYLLENDEEDDD